MQNPEAKAKPASASTHAAAVLSRIFRQAAPGFRYRLWDGSEGSVGIGAGEWTLIVRDPASFRSAIAAGNTARIAGAFVDKQLDIEGDIFAAMRSANQLEDLKLSLWDRLRLLIDLRAI